MEPYWYPMDANFHHLGNFLFLNTVYFVIISAMINSTFVKEEVIEEVGKTRSLFLYYLLTRID